MRTREYGHSGALRGLPASPRPGRPEVRSGNPPESCGWKLPRRTRVWARLGASSSDLGKEAGLRCPEPVWRELGQTGSGLLGTPKFGLFANSSAGSTPCTSDSEPPTPVPSPKTPLEPAVDFTHRRAAAAGDAPEAHPSARRYDLERVLRVAGRIADQSRDAYAKEQTMRALAAVARHPRADRVLAHRVASAMTSIARVARDNITPMSAANALRTVLMRLHADGVVFEEALSLADGLLDPGRHVALQKAATQVLLEIVRSPAAGERLTRRVLQRAVSVIGSLGREAEVKAGAFQTVAYVVGSEWATREAVRTALSLCEGALSSSGCGETVPRWLLRDVSAMLRQVLGTLSAVARSEHCSAADIAWILRVCTQLAVVDEAATKESVAVTLRWLAWNPASGSGVLATILAELEAMRGDRSVRKSVIRSALSEISARLLSPAFPDAPRAQLLAQSFVLDEQLEIWEDTGPLACPAAIDLLRDTPREIQLAAPWLQRYGLPGELVTDISSFVTNEEQEEAERLILRICAEAAAQGSGEVAIALWRGACLPHPRSGAEASRRLAEAIDRPGSLLSVVPWGPAELGEVGDCLAERPPDPQGILAERASAVLRAAAALLRLVPPGDRDPLAPGLARLCASVAATAAGSAAEARFVADFREACAGSGVPVPRLA